MKKGNYRLHLLKFSLVLSFFASFSAGSMKVEAQSISIDGSLQGVTADSIVFYLYPYFSYFWQNSNATTCTAAVKANKFTFQSNLQTEHSYLSAYLINNGQPQPLCILFLVVPGDHINITIKEDTTIFEGQGASKFVCQYQIQKVPGISFTKQELLYFRGDIKDLSYDLAFKRYALKKSDSLLETKLAILEKFKSVLERDSYEQLEVNLIAEDLFDHYKSLSLDFRYDSSEAACQREDRIAYFRELEKYHLPEGCNDKILAESPAAADYLLYKVKRQQQFRNYLSKTHAPQTYDPLKIANIAASGHGQLLKERLMTLSFHLYYRPESKTEMEKLETALKDTKTPYFHSFLLDLKTARNPGTDAYNFTLFTPDDKKITLNDFKGKVVVLDFWFTGCSYCVHLEKRMKRIRDFFANDTCVVFIAVNLDTDKEEFLQSLASGEYTGENETNLYTKGTAFEDPLVQYYNVIGCPELVIIDRNHKTLSSKPPRPIDEATDQQFIDLVLKAKKAGF